MRKIINKFTKSFNVVGLCTHASINSRRSRPAQIASRPFRISEYISRRHKQWAAREKMKKLHIFILAKHAKRSNNSIDHNIKYTNIFSFHFISVFLSPFVFFVCADQEMQSYAPQNTCKMIDAY